MSDTVNGLSDKNITNKPLNLEVVMLNKPLFNPEFQQHHVTSVVSLKKCPGENVLKTIITPEICMKRTFNVPAK